MADLPIKELGDEAPVYDRPLCRDAEAAGDRCGRRDAADVNTVDALLKLIGSPDLCSRRWVWEQYDHVILGNTVQRPGGDAAVVRVNDGPKALALTADVTPRYCEADPFEGGKQAVAEAWRNITAVGGRPLADHRQSQFRQSGAAGDHGPARRLHPRHRRGLHGARFPGRVRQRLALQRDQRPRDPADADHRRRRPARRFHQVGDARLQGRASEAILLIGETTGWLGQSLYLREICEREEGAPPPVDLAVERRNGDFVRALIAEGIATAVHDVSDGGLLVALAEMAMASGIGAELEAPPITAHAFWFGEDQARYVVTVDAGVAERTHGPRARRRRAGPRSLESRPAMH